MTDPNQTQAVPDWRAEAEARGRAAFETAITEPPTPAPPAWWESPKGKEPQ